MALLTNELEALEELWVFGCNRWAWQGKGRRSWEGSRSRKGHVEWSWLGLGLGLRLRLRLRVTKEGLGVEEGEVIERAIGMKASSG